jgi:hypothetical protein
VGATKRGPSPVGGTLERAQHRQGRPSPRPICRRSDGSGCRRRPRSRRAKAARLGVAHRTRLWRAGIETGAATDAVGAR